MRRRWCLLWLVICLGGCLPYPAVNGTLTSSLPAWQYADLRRVDAADGPMPSQDVVALYTRTVDEDAQIRLDYLDYPPQADHDLKLYIGMAQQSNGEPGDETPEWDYLITIPADGTPQVVTPENANIPGVELRIERDTGLDRLVVSFNAASLKLYLPRAEVWVRLTSPGQDDLLDGISPVAWQASPPPRLPVLVGFWNTFSAATPAQTLRRWDGAHSGPNSARHGLRNLLAAVEQTRSPIILFDLKTPTALSALDHLGGISQVRALAEQGLLLLPDVLPVAFPTNPRFSIPDWVYPEILSDSKVAATAFGLPASPFVSAGLWWDARFVRGVRFVFISDTDCYFKNGVGVGMFASKKWFCSYGYAQFTDASVDSNGLTMQSRQNLANQAAQGTREIYFLGADLAQSSWGEPSAALKALSYIADHPWLEPLGPDDLLTFPAEAAQPNIQDMIQMPLPLYMPSGERLASGLDSAQLHAEVIQALSAAQSDVFRDLAWQMYEMLLTPGSQALTDLRLAYLGQIGHLLAASRWSIDPRTGADCSQDLDWDGLVECTLSSDDFFAVFESEGGGITVAAARTTGGFTQVIAPTYQFSIGLSDPSTWDTTRGIAGDPAQLFAFTETAKAWERLDVQTGADAITFSSQGIAIKTFELTEEGLLISFHDPGFHTIGIPIVLDPGSRFTPNWSWFLTGTPGEQAWSWAKEGEVAIKVRSNGQITALAFNESKELLSQPEDPNYAYPAGHYVPFPMALLRIEAEGPLQIEFVVIDLN